MTNSTLAALSDELADGVAAAADSVVQVIGGRRPASGTVHGPDIIVTTARAIGREDGLRVQLPGAAEDPVDADLAGWDPATGIAVLRTRSPMKLKAPTLAEQEPRPGQIVYALARSWSNAITATAGVVAVVGGPLRTGRHRSIPRVFRVTAPMHDGFAGGAVFDATGRLAGIATAATIRGYAVAIPASIAWASAAQVLASGTPKRAFVGVGVQSVVLAPAQRTEGRERALLVVSVAANSPAEAAGVIVGDVVVAVDGQPSETADDLLDVLSDRHVGDTVVARILRGGAVRDVPVTVADRPRE